jgi:hypothetical protein
MAYYMLIDGKIIATNDVIEWAKWNEAKDARRVDYTDVKGFYVSTVFLGIDHNWAFDGSKPILFETMVFENKVETIKMFGRDFNFHPEKDEYTERYCELEDAKKGHRRIVNKLTGALKLVAGGA